MLFAFTSVLHLQGILTGTVGNSWSQVERPGEACGLSTGQEGTVTHCSGQANCVDSSNQGTNTAVLWLIFNKVIFFHQHITYFHFDISNMVGLQMVVSEMPGHQNNLACASVSYRVFLFTSFFSVFYRLKSYIAFEAKNRVIYKRILTLTPSVHRMSCHLTGKSPSLASSPTMCFTTIYDPNTNVFPCPHWTWPERPSLIFEGLKSPMSVTPCPAHSDVPHSTPLLSSIATCQSTWHTELQLLTEDINYLVQHWAQLH